VLDEADFDAEEVAELFGCEEFPFGGVGEDAAFAHHDDAVDFGKDVGDVVGDEKDAGALLSYAAEGRAEFALGGEVEGVGGLVEQEHLRPVDEGAGDHDAALLAGRHLSDEFRFEVRGLHEVESLVGALAHLRGDVEIGPEGRGGEEAGDNGVKAGGDGGALAREFGGDDAEVGTELGDVPARAAEETEIGRGGDDGVALAGEGFDEGGFAAAIGTEDGKVFTVGDAEGDGVEDDVVAAGDTDVAHEEEVGLVHDGQALRKKLFQSAKLIDSGKAVVET